MTSSPASIAFCRASAFARRASMAANSAFCGSPPPLVLVAAPGGPPAGGGGGGGGGGAPPPAGGGGGGGGTPPPVGGGGGGGGGAPPPVGGGGGGGGGAPPPVGGGGGDGAAAETGGGLIAGDADSRRAVSASAGGVVSRSGGAEGIAQIGGVHSARCSSSEGRLVPTRSRKLAVNASACFGTAGSSTSKRWSSARISCALSPEHDMFCHWYDESLRISSTAINSSFSSARRPKRLASASSTLADGAVPPPSRLASSRRHTHEWHR